METKQNEKANSLPQISGVVVLHHKMVSPQMVSPQNGVTRGGPPPLATSLVPAKGVGRKILMGAK